MAQGWRQGLFLHCVDEAAERPLPFDLEVKVGCYRVRDKCELFTPQRSHPSAARRNQSCSLSTFPDYIHITAALCILALVTDIFATLLTGDYY